MEDNYSDTENIIRGKRNDKFQTRVKTLKGLILSLLIFGTVLTIFAAITWNNSSNDILRALAVTGLVTVFASVIGLIGCNRCLSALEVVKVTKMKTSPGQESLLIFFYFNFLLFCSYLLFGTWCFFYQDDVSTWLDAKYAENHASWERDFKVIKLDTVQQNIQLILTIAGAFSLVVAIINFACIHYAIKISLFFETIHTIVQVQNLVLVLISFLIIYAGAIAKSYYNVPYVEETEPDFLPQVLIFTGVAMILVAYLGFIASRAESKVGLIAYTIFCVILMINFLIFIVLLNFGSQVLQQQFEEKCNEVMPYFHKNFYESFGCTNKYNSNTTDPTRLQCPKYQVAAIWEQNVEVAIDEQSEFYGCLNQSCCIAMISFVKGKFNFLAAFCIVAFFFCMVAIMTSQYMYKKIKKYHTQILSHRNDKFIFIFMLVFTLGLTVITYLNMPEGPRGMPQPDKAKSELEGDDLAKFYDLHQDREIGLGSLSDDGWWDFERVQLFQSDYQPSVNGDNSSESNSSSSSSGENFKVEVTIKAYPSGEFLIRGGLNNLTTTINTNHSRITIKGTTQEVNSTLSNLLYKPGCITNPLNHLELNITFTSSRLLQQTITNSTTNQTTQPDSSSSDLTIGVPKRYKISTSLNSGGSRKYRGKIIEENLEATGSANYFKEVQSPSSDIKLTVSYPQFKDCPVLTVPVDSHGVFEFNMTILNMSIPYLIKVRAERSIYPQPIIFDYFVGGLPHSSVVELGAYAFYMSDSKQHNVTGRVYEAFTNKTFSDDYSLSVYVGYGELNQTHSDAYEVIDQFGNGIYYTGQYELYDLKAGPYVAVVDSPANYIKNFQRFYALPSPPFSRHMRAIPIVPTLLPGELALVLTWGYSPRDLDIHVEFIGGPTILCKADYSVHQCGGVHYMTDAIEGGDHGADVIKFDYIGDFQYLVYISHFRARLNSTSQPSKSEQDVPLTDSQAQIKVFSPYYSWPVYIFDVPAQASNPNANYWTVFCLNGKDGLRRLTPINQLSQASPDVTTCQEVYGNPNALLNPEGDQDIENGTN